MSGQVECSNCESTNTVIVREGAKSVTPETADHIGCFDCGEMETVK